MAVAGTRCKRAPSTTAAYSDSIVDAWFWSGRFVENMFCWYNALAHAMPGAIKVEPADGTITVDIGLGVAHVGKAHECYVVVENGKPRLIPKACFQDHWLALNGSSLKAGPRMDD